MSLSEKRKLEDDDNVQYKKQKICINHKKEKLLFQMKKTETKNPVFKLLSSKDYSVIDYISQKRKTLIEWMNNTRLFFGFSEIVFNLAVQYLDIMFSKAVYPLTYYQLVASICLMLAGIFIIKNSKNGWYFIVSYL